MSLVVLSAGELLALELAGSAFVAGVLVGLALAGAVARSWVGR